MLKEEADLKLVSLTFSLSVAAFFFSYIKKKKQKKTMVAIRSMAINKPPKPWTKQTLDLSKHSTPTHQVLLFYVSPLLIPDEN